MYLVASESCVEGMQRLKLVWDGLNCAIPDINYTRT